MMMPNPKKSVPNPGLDWMVDNCENCQFESTCNLKKRLFDFFMMGGEVHKNDQEKIGFIEDSFPVDCAMKQEKM